MKPFTGQAEATIDAKQRLAVPSKFRAVMDPQEHGSAWYAVPWADGLLIRMYPERSFEALAQSRVATLTPDANAAELESNLFSSAERLEMDATGRVRLPQWHLDLTGLPNEVMVVGANGWLEIRNRAAWDATKRERFARLPVLAERASKTPAASVVHGATA